MDEEKSPLIRLKEVVFRGSLCFTVSSLVYVAVMSAMLSGADGEPGAVFSLLLRNFAVILAASAVFGVSSCCLRSNGFRPRHEGHSISFCFMRIL